ncbi:MAG: sulfate ABC transporter substrate-binding protein [Spirochaetia bacterium]|nr:sulfate ABC transporter substrate-binding protein [Spirochaetia bacterium]
MTQTFTKILLLLVFFAGTSFAGPSLLNVSYDPTRELYAQYNSLFADYYKKKAGQKIDIKQSHGGSGKQARSVIDGLEADVVTLALAYDIDALADKASLLPKDWQKRLPNNSSPYTSTIIFLVRKGNPKKIKDWDDLVKGGVSVITPNPKTSGGARWNYLAAWAFASAKFGGDEGKIKGFLKTLFQNVPVLDSGARGSTHTFVNREIGDVLLSWENEAFLAEKELGKGSVERVIPSISVLAEPPVALVDKNAEKHKTAEIAKAYLDYLYSPEAQELIAKNFYRPRDAKVASKYSKIFPQLKMATIDEAFGGWKAAQKKHFDDGGVFDQIYNKK